MPKAKKRLKKCGKEGIIKMNGKQYNNVINHTLKNLSETDTLSTARAVFKNMGVALPQGDIKAVYDAVKTDNYMGWKSCSMDEAQTAANNGTAAIGISESRIVVLAADDEEEPVARNVSVMAVTNTTPARSVSDLAFYSYSYGTTSGCVIDPDIGSYNDRYTYELVNTFGFSCEVANLIRSLYDKVDSKFYAETKLQRAWKCSRILSMFLYDGLPWDNVAASVVSLSNAQEYFVNILGYTISEYKTIKNAITNQHNDYSTPDFTHLQYALSARLAYTLDKDDFWSNIFTLNTDENISYLAGWLGDATLVENGTTSMADDDYCADLDAECAYRKIISGYTSVGAFNNYYASLNICNTRANVFRSYISYSTVQEMFFYELIDKQLSILMSTASQQGDIYMTNYYLKLINDEQYHWNTIISNYPDTYNFLLTLRNGKAHIVDY